MNPNPNQALWEKGDFTRIAASMRESGDALVESLGITKGMKVLDLGCGDGTTAVPEARRGAEVLGVDISRNLVEAANRRAKELGLSNLAVRQGDACNLQGLEDGRFDLVVSIFGAMFAPKPFDVAKEMVRVTRSGGRIVMGNWIPNDPTLVAQLLKISSAYTPPPPEGFVSPMTWGVEANVVERFGAAGVPKERIAFAARHVHLRVSGPAVGARRGIPELLRADDERLRGGREDRTRRRAREGIERALREGEPRRKQGQDLDPRDLLAGDGQALTLPRRTGPRRVRAPQKALATSA